MNFEMWRFFLDAAIVIGNIVLWIYMILVNRQKVTNKRFAILEQAVAERIKKADLDEAKKKRDETCGQHQRETKALEQAYNALHSELSHLPDRKEVKELAETMRHLTEKIGNLDGRMSGVNRAVDLINQFLIDQGGKK